MKLASIVLSTLLAIQPASAGKCDTPDYQKLIGYINTWLPIAERSSETMRINYQAQKVPALRANMGAHVSYLGLGIGGVSAVVAAILYGLPIGAITLVVGGATPLMWVNGVPISAMFFATVTGVALYFTNALEPDADPEANHPPITPADKFPPQVILRGIKLADHIGNELLKDKFVSLNRRTRYYDEIKTKLGFTFGLARGALDQNYNNLLLEEARFKYVIAKARADFYREQRENLRHFCGTL